MMPFSELPDWDDLRPGDILLFLPWHLQKVPLTTKVIMLAQALYYAREGYYPVTHAAIYSGKQGGAHQLIHVAETGYCYRKESLEEIEQFDHEKRPFIVFRPKSEQVANRIASVANTVGYTYEQKNKKITWSFFSAVSSLARRSALPADQVHSLDDCKITEKTHCSKFTVECIRIAALELAQPKYVLHIDPTITPAGLFKALFNNGNYQQLNYLAGIDPYIELNKEIVAHLTRVGTRNDEPSREKFKICMAEFSRLKKQLDGLSISGLEKCVSMIKSLLPLLAKHTGFSLYQEARSARELREWARKKGIFEPVVSRFSLRV